MKAIRFAIVSRMRGIVLALCLGVALPASAQRVEFPTMVPGTTAPPPATFSPGPPAAAPLSQTFDPYAAPLSQPAAPYGAAPTYTPYAAPAPAPYSPYAPSPYSPTPQALYPEGIATPQILPPGGFDYRQPFRFMQEVRGRWTWLSPMGSNKLGVNDVETSATFAVPFFRSSAPFLVTPGFGIHFWDGPVSVPPNPADLPPNTYDGYLDGAWHPQFSPWFGANLGVRVGAYTDFNTFTIHSIRVMGRGLGVITLTPTLTVSLGVVYIDRVLVKILPAGGLTWTPNPDARYEILFPNPKLAHRWTTLGNTDIWGYISGEYGGGSWTIQRADGTNDQADYNDIRVSLGLDAYGYRGLHGFFEVGYAFDREIVYRSSTPTFHPSDTVMLRAGLAY